jgi:hypothetical protein
MRGVPAPDARDPDRLPELRQGGLDGTRELLEALVGSWREIYISLNRCKRNRNYIGKTWLT